MTEQEWLASEDPAAMLSWLMDTSTARGFRDHRHDGQRYNGGPSGRKLRLFACACCRQVWDLLTDERSREAVETAERFADGPATTEELGAASDAALAVAEYVATSANAPSAAWAAASAAVKVCYNSALLAARFAPFDAAAASDEPRSTVLSRQAALLREIVGNPFRPVTLPLTFVGCEFCGQSGRIKSTKGIGTCPRCDGLGRFSIGCPWLTETVRGIARTIYADCDFAWLPILTDALEDAGCTEGVLLRHLRGETETIRMTCKCGGKLVPLKKDMLPRLAVCERCHTEAGFWADVERGIKPGPHVRGCWALDLILGRE